MSSAQHSVHLYAASVGFISLALLWLGVLAGIAVRIGWALTWVRHQTLSGAHQLFATLGLTLAALHGFAQLAVPGGSVGVVAEVVPLADAHDRVGVGAGALALELMTAIALSVLVQRRLGYHRWRVVHRFAYLAFALAALHVLRSGSDVHGLVRVLVTGALLGTAGAYVAVHWRTASFIRRIFERVGAFLRSTQAVVQVDPSRCVRFGFCVQEAPEVFQLHGEGQLSYLAAVPADQLDRAIEAARVCPARAIVVGRTATTVVVPTVSGTRASGAG
jgi:sulfoxide reductase heme-binding subunit YedZ